MESRGRAALDAMVRDACEQQAALGRLPAPQAASAELRPVIERVEKKRTGQAAVKAPPRKETSIDQIAAAYRKAGGAGQNVRLERPSPDAPVIRRPNMAKAKRLARRRLGERIRWMVERDPQGNPLRPDYERRVKEMCTAFLDVGVGNKQAAVDAFEVLLSDSDRHVGRPWHQAPPRPLYSKP